MVGVKNLWLCRRFRGLPQTAVNWNCCARSEHNWLQSITPNATTNNTNDIRWCCFFFLGGAMFNTHIYIYTHKIYWYVLSSGTVPESIVLARKACGLPGVVTALNTLRPVADTLSWSQLGIKEAQGITFVLQETSSTSGIIAGQSSLGTRGCCGLDFHVSQRMNISFASTLSLSLTACILYNIVYT